MFKKYLAPVVSLTLVAALAIGGTMAYLSDATEEVTNTFVFSTDDAVTLELIETVFGTEYDATGLNYDTDTLVTADMVPGSDIAKNPAVTPTGSDCYLFIQVIEENNDAAVTSDAVYFTYDIATDSTSIEYSTYYWKEVTTTEDNKFYMLVDAYGTAMVVSEDTTNNTYYILTDKIAYDIVNTENTGTEYDNETYDSTSYSDALSATKLAVSGSVTVSTALTHEDMMALYVAAEDDVLTDLEAYIANSDAELTAVTSISASENSIYIVTVGDGETTYYVQEFDGNYYEVVADSADYELVPITELPTLEFIAYAVQATNVAADDAEDVFTSAFDINTAE